MACDTLGIFAMNVVQTIYTPLKINMEPKNAGLEDDFPFQIGDL